MISVIIPVYNVEEFLEKCLESVIIQSYKNIEILLINDGSTDKSGDICDEYSAKFSNIQTYHTHNKGQASARNLGLTLAKGEYILFMDSDDLYINSFAIETLINTAIKEDSDVVCFNYCRNENKRPQIKFNKKYTDDIEEIISYNIYTSSACLKLIKNKLLKDNNILFPEGKYTEDILFCGKILENTNKITFLNELFYSYTIRKSSSSRNITPKFIYDCFEIIKTLSETKNEFLLSYLAFQYATLLININLCIKPIKQDALNNIYEFKNILRFGKFNTIKIISALSRLIGPRLTGKLLYLSFKISKR